MHLVDDVARVEVAAARRRPCSAIAGAPLREGDVAALVLQVDLDRVQAVLLQREVLLELAGELISGPVTWTPRISSGGVEWNGLAGSAAATGSSVTDARRPGRPEKLDEPEERGGGEHREHGERGQAAAPDLASPQLAPLAAKLADLDIRGSCQRGSGS